MMLDKSWQTLFPIQEAENAVDVLVKAWNELASRNLTSFNRKTIEPKLTLVLCQQLRDFFSEKAGLMGDWGAENLGASIDQENLEILEKYRTDIQYRWNNKHQRLCLIFEFKKVDHTLTSRKYYYGDRGMTKFITGHYSKRQPVALMVAVLTKPYDKCVPPLIQELQSEDVVKNLDMIIKSEETAICKPSVLFPNHASFDTHHNRSTNLAPSHGNIGIAHLFLGFPE